MDGLDYIPAHGALGELGKCALKMLVLMRERGAGGEKSGEQDEQEKIEEAEVLEENI